MALTIVRSEKNSLNIKFLGGIFLGHPGPRRRDIPDKNFMQVAFLCCFRPGVAGMARDLGRDVPDLEKYIVSTCCAQTVGGYENRSIMNSSVSRGFTRSGKSNLRTSTGLSGMFSKMFGLLGPYDLRSYWKIGKIIRTCDFTFFGGTRYWYASFSSV